MVQKYVTLSSLDLTLAINHAIEIMQNIFVDDWGHAKYLLHYLEGVIYYGD